jgi:FemAB family protein
MTDWRQEFSASSLDQIFREDDPELWNATYSCLTYRPVSYLASVLDYQLAYQRYRGGNWGDFSCILRSNGCPVAIWSIIAATSAVATDPKALGLLVMPPLFVGDCSVSIRKKYSIECLRISERIATQLGLIEWQSATMFTDRASIDDWQISAMGLGAHCAVKHQLYVDLHMPIAQIKSGLRKSFRSLVTSGERLWHVGILRAPGNSDIWDEFRLLHAEVAGQVTRPLETWQMLHDNLSNNESFLVYLRDVDDRMVGGGYFRCSADEGVYAVGAYDRNLFDKPLGHVVQFQAIKEMQLRGCRWYHIGTRGFPSDEPAPSQKEIDISYFKQGFSSHVFPSFLLTHSATVEQL